MLYPVFPFITRAKKYCFERLIPVMKINKIAMLLSQGMPEETKLSLQPSGHTQTERCARSKGVHNLFFFLKKI